MRVKTRWNVKDKPRSTEEIAGALGFILWRIACNGVLDLENENFQTDDQRQRLDVISAFLVFLIHTVDRLAYERFDQEQREALIRSLALRVVSILEDNARDAAGEERRREAFIDALNAGMNEYAELEFRPDGPSFSYMRFFAAEVAGAMGPRDNQWIIDHVMAVEGPEALETLTKAMESLTAGLGADKTAS